MAEDLDVDDLLEEQFRKNYKDGTPTSSVSNSNTKSPTIGEEEGSKKHHKKSSKRSSRSRSRSPSTERPNGGGELTSSGTNGKHHKSSKRDRDKERSKDKDRDRKRSKSRERKEGDLKRRDRSRSRDRHSKSSKGRDRDKDRDKARKRSRSPRDRADRKRSRSPRDAKDSRRRSRSPIRDRDRRSRRSPFAGGARDWGARYGGRSRSNSREGMSAEDRDLRTVFCMQLAPRITSRDLDKFFSSVGKVREVRLIMDNKTRRHKGIAYVEFYDIESVPLALALHGEKLCGASLNIQPTQAEKNRAAAAQAALTARYNSSRGGSVRGPTRLYVGSLHFNINEDMLRGIFEPFGKIEQITIMRDPETGRSRGYGFITFYEAEDAKKALEQLNGFELAGRFIKVNTVTPSQYDNFAALGPSVLDDTEREGIELGSHGRLALMAKLAEGTGIVMPPAAAAALKLPHSSGTVANGFISGPTMSSTMAASSNGTSTFGSTTMSMASMTTQATQEPASKPTPPIATQCFLLTNMFNPAEESDPEWADEIRADVLDQALAHGGAVHIFVDQVSPVGNVYVKAPTIESATSCVNALHGRWFSGRQIQAAYVPLESYYLLFPDAVNATTILEPE